LRQSSDFTGHTGLKVLDLCSGTGCIPLLLYGLLAPKFPGIEVLGVDISNSAIRLANENLHHNIIHGHLPRKGLSRVSFLKADVLSHKFAEAESRIAHSAWDVVISNPPYISQKGFGKDTQRSVRNWEPKLALVPRIDQDITMEDSHPEDIFYHRILEVAKAANSRVVLMEVGDIEQAIRVSRIAVDFGIWTSVEIWKDWPDMYPDQLADKEEVFVREHKIPVRGSGNGRSVMCRRQL
jgi:methylase of polypeptide subunit release factors